MSAHHPRPLFGVRTQPGRLFLAAMRLPRPLYHHGLGRLLGHTFLLIAHQGRKTGRRRETVAMALAWNPDTRQAIVFSAWGETQWVRNLRAHAALEIQIGGDRFTPQQHFLTAEDAVAVVVAFRQRHPWRMRLFSLILDWGELSTEAALREFVSNRPFVAFRPADSEARQTAPAIAI